LDIIDQLKKLKAEIVEVEDIKGGIAGMFWRFLVADDPTVDRYVPKLRLFFSLKKSFRFRARTRPPKRYTLIVWIFLLTSFVKLLLLSHFCDCLF